MPSQENKKQNYDYLPRFRDLDLDLDLDHDLDGDLDSDLDLDLDFPSRGEGDRAYLIYIINK